MTTGELELNLVYDARTVPVENLQFLLNQCTITLLPM